MGDFTALNEAVIKGDIQAAITETQKALDVGQKDQRALLEEERGLGRSEDLAQE